MNKIRLFFFIFLSGCSTAFKVSGYRDADPHSYCRSFKSEGQKNLARELIFINDKKSLVTIEPQEDQGTTLFGPIFIPIKLGKSNVIIFKVDFQLLVQNSNEDLAQWTLISGEENIHPTSKVNLNVNHSGSYYIDFEFKETPEDTITLVAKSQKIILVNAEDGWHYVPLIAPHTAGLRKSLNCEN